MGTDRPTSTGRSSGRSPAKSIWKRHPRWCRDHINDVHKNVVGMTKTHIVEIVQRPGEEPRLSVYDPEQPSEFALCDVTPDQVFALSLLLEDANNVPEVRKLLDDAWSLLSLRPTLMQRIADRVMELAR